MIVYTDRLLKKSSNRKSKLVLSRLVTIWLSNITFHLRPIWLRTLIAIDSESCQTSFPSICAPPSEVAVLLNSNLSRRPFLWQLVDFDLLLCTGFDSEPAVLFLCHIFTQRPMNVRKIKRSDGRGFGRQQLLVNSMGSSFPNEKKSVVTAQYLQSIKTFLTVELSHYSKSGSTFSSSEPVAARSDCRRLGNALCLCSPVQPAHAVPERCPKSLATDIAVKSFDCLLE